MYIIPYLVSNEFEISPLVFTSKAKTLDLAIEELKLDLIKNHNIGPVFFDQFEVFDETDYILINKNSHLIIL
jgi:hypothetical protein